MSLFIVHKFTQLCECCGTVTRACVCSHYTSSRSCMNVLAQWLWHDFVHSTQVHAAVWMFWHSGFGMTLFIVHKFTQLYECCGTVARAWVCSRYTSSHSCMNVVAQWLGHEFVHSTQVHKFTQLYECCGTVARAWVCSQYTSSHSWMNVVAQWLGHEFVHSTQVSSRSCMNVVAQWLGHEFVHSTQVSSRTCVNVVAQWLGHEFVHSTQVHAAVWMLWHSG